MRGVVCVLLFIVVVVGLILLNGAQSGVPVTGSGITALFAPNPGVLDSAAAQRRAEADALAAQAQAARDWSARSTADAAQVIFDEQTRQTQEAAQATAAVAATATQESFSATIQAGQALATSTAQAEATRQVFEVARMQTTATADAVKLAALSVQATKIAKDTQDQMARDTIRLEVESKTSYFRAYWPLGLLALILLGVTYFGYRIVNIYASKSGMLIPANAYGTHDAVIYAGKIHNPDQMAVASIDPRLNTNQVSADQEHEVARLHQGTRAIFGLTQAGYKQHAYQAANQLTGRAGGSTPQIEVTQPEKNSLPTIAPWDLSGWTGKTLPLGIGEGDSGIELIPEHTAGLFVFGTSNSGKTTGAMRPIAAEALAGGCGVIIINPKGGDFAPFSGQPNLKVINGRAGEIADALEAVVCEVERRNRLLGEAQVSTYYRLGNAADYLGPRYVVMVEELVSLINGAPSDAIRNRLWSAAVDITSRCRAFGMTMVFASTDATYRTLGKRGLSVRDNCGRMIFRVRDQSTSLAALDIGGAESLTGNQFLVQLDTPKPVKGVAFHPEDGEISRFLASRNIPLLPPMKFLGEEKKPEITEPAIPMVDPETVTIAEKIRAAWMAGESKRRIAQEAGMVYAGNYIPKIDRAIEYLTANANGSTSGKSPDIANNVSTVSS